MYFPTHSDHILNRSWSLTSQSPKLSPQSNSAKVQLCRAVGAGPAGPVAAEPIFRQPTRTKYRMSFGRLFNCSRSRWYARQGSQKTDVIQNNSVGGWSQARFVAWRKPLSKRKVWENYTMNYSQLIVNSWAIMAAKSVKCNASFSSVTVATKSLGFSDNGFKTA